MDRQLYRSGISTIAPVRYASQLANAHSYCSQALANNCLRSSQSSYVNVEVESDKSPGPAVVETSMILVRAIRVESESSSEESSAGCGIAAK